MGFSDKRLPPNMVSLTQMIVGSKRDPIDLRCMQEVPDCADFHMITWSRNHDTITKLQVSNARDWFMLYFVAFRDNAFRDIDTA